MWSLDLIKIVAKLHHDFLNNLVIDIPKDGLIFTRKSLIVGWLEESKSGVKQQH